MTAQPAGLVTIILVAAGTIAADRSSVKLCPCTRGCCDENWFQYKDACYWPGNNPQSWNDAEESCAVQNAQLASVHTPEEDQFIFYLMGRRGSYWLGAKKSSRDHNSHWHWTDNSSWDYASVKLNSKSQMWQNHVVVERPDDDDDGQVSWKYETAFNKRHMFVCKYLLG